jgi:hypothetical protein
MVYLVFTDTGNFQAAFAHEDDAEDFALPTQEIIPFDKATVYDDREA